MNRRWVWLAVALSVSLLWQSAASAQAVKEQPKAKKVGPSTTTPAPKKEAWWVKRHESMNDRVKQGKVDLVLIGDSITHGWEGKGKQVWAKYYAKRNAVNLGIGGDQTQHVLWRLENGNLAGISPKLAVLMIGTNNSHANTPQQIADGIKAIVATIRAKSPTTKVLVLAIFPRGADKQNANRLVNEKANQIVAKLADNKAVFFQDIGKGFENPDGTLPREIMPDLLHLSEKGYTIWAESIEPMVAKLMGEK